MWNRLGRYFHDPRLRQLFGRYATYCGSSPYAAPATLMLIAHVEQDGVWSIAGGMRRLADALATLATRAGAAFRYGDDVAEVLTERGAACGVRLASGEQLTADLVVVNADANAVACGLLGEGLRDATRRTAPEARSLSAVTWSLHAPTAGFPLVRHNVFFSADYAAEFDALFRRGALPAAPTVYVCAQDRPGRDSAGAPPARERLLVLVNAPAVDDQRPFAPPETSSCEDRTFSLLTRCGLTIRREPDSTTLTTPADFARLFPGTGGALYGQATHGWRASFQRPGSRTRVPRLYLAGGSTHPGAGVPMAALSGRLAAASALADLASTRR
jgi:1-hydroxycarotenoid 3,4-desaturase